MPKALVIPPPGPGSREVNRGVVPGFVDMHMRPRVLVIDDEPAIRAGVRRRLEAEGYEVGEAPDCATAIEALDGFAPDVAIADYELPDGDALTVLERVRERLPDLAVVVLTGHGTIERAVQAVKAGAEQFLTKPVELDSLVGLVRRMLEQQRAERQRRVEHDRASAFPLDPFLGTSAVMRRLASDAARVASAEGPVLLIGPTGAGKGVLAAWLHQHGPRAAAPFTDLNCAGFSREFLETELFGHKKGAFTGAISDKPGLIEAADGGCVFLDEIGDLDLALQPKLLKVLEDRRFRRLGEVTDRVVDVRLIAASNVNLATLVAERRFRDDLFFRLSTYVLRTPGLAERREDIPLLATRITSQLGGSMGRGELTLEIDAMTALCEYSWPGNVRELRNVLERSITFSDPDRPTLRRSDLRFESIEWVRPESAPDLTLDEREREIILRTYKEEDGRVDAVAQRLGVARSTLYDKLKRYGVTLRR
jgi:DNA-binding NtrC family response regulator